jgi:DNA phosphorothioation-dependent restriction protein DptF
MNNLNHIVAKLSKSSAEAVHTFNQNSATLFKYLHIVTDVENAYIQKLESLHKQKALIFLCGSSGDGKSAIIAKHQEEFKTDYDFHVDATHSFMPNQTAIEALENSFSNFTNGEKSLVVGINIGILMNYFSDEKSSNEIIKTAIGKYLTSKSDSENIFFINFEDYSKFDFDGKIISSDFIKSIFQKITSQSSSNPFYNALLQDINEGETSKIHQNYKLLSQEPIQNSIIELLITIHLKYDQFLTTRSLLDLIYILLNDKVLLIDQLFEDESNVIIQNFRKEDPILQRSFLLDKFILDRASNYQDTELELFINEFNTLCKHELIYTASSFTLIRLFYLYRDYDFANNYHQHYKKSFENYLIHDFVRLVSIHHNYDETNKKVIQEFYQKIETAIFSYINKTNPKLSKNNLIMVANTEDIMSAIPIDVSPEWSKIKSYESNSFSEFPLFLKINEKTSIEKKISLNLYSMIILINDGYRPNKHDRNTIILFDELIQSILEIVNKGNEIYLLTNGEKVLFKNTDDEIKVKVYEA